MNLKVTYRRFYLQRHEDETGISGTGRIAEGIVFSDGCAVLRWLSAVSTTVVFDNLDAVRSIHGHDGRTEIIFEDFLNDDGSLIRTEKPKKKKPSK